MIKPPFIVILYQFRKGGRRKNKHFLHKNIRLEGRMFQVKKPFFCTLPRMQSSFQRKIGSGHACAGCIHCRKLRKPLRKAGKYLRHTGCCASWLELRNRTSPRIPGQDGCIRPSSQPLLPSDICQSSGCRLQDILAGFDAFLISRFHETHSFFLVFPLLYPALKSEKHKKKTAVHPVQQFIGYSARP